MFLLAACSVHKKLDRLEKGVAPTVRLALGKEETFVPKVNDAALVKKDTLKIVDEDGTETLIMRAIKDDETGEMVAADVLNAATVTAPFRNVAERMGKVDLAFNVIVPEAMRDSKWQLRFYPDMYIQSDSVSLDPVIITGEGYRKYQLRGYQQYSRFLSKIVEDSTRFINLNLLEIFLERNIPEIYAFKTDSSFVSDEKFQTVFGVTQQQAIDHYTKKIAKNRNERRMSNRQKMYNRYVKAPIVTEGIRLDTVLVNAQGDFVYNYVQTINTRPGLRKVDIVLSGDIYEQDTRIYKIPQGSPLTFYISSVAAFVDNTERYKTKVVERRAVANAECRIEFSEGSDEIKSELGDNVYEISKIRNMLSSVVENEIYDLDSIVVRATASPEGTYSANANLAQRRSESVSHYFNNYMVNYVDSLKRERGFSVNVDNTWAETGHTYNTVSFSPRCIPENWEDMYQYVSKDVVLNDDQKESFFDIYKIENHDERENALKSTNYYSYLKEAVYPRLRTVRFNFYLHRKGMTKDTVHTTVIDSTYMRGVAALKDMDYAGALALLRPYRDFNTAIAYVGLDRNANAMQILQGLEKNAQVNYMLALLYSRSGEESKAVECYVKSCKQNPMYVHRGNLDPEIAVLIKTFGLNQQEDEPLEF